MISKSIIFHGVYNISRMHVQVCDTDSHVIVWKFFVYSGIIINLINLILPSFVMRLLCIILYADEKIHKLLTLAWAYVTFLEGY